MSGLAIIILTVLAVVVFVLIIKFSFVLLDAVTEFCTDKDRSIAIQALLLLPWIALTLWCFVLNIFVVICALFTGYTIATGARNWWHKGLKK